MTRFFQGTMVNGEIFGDPEYAGWVFIEWLYPGQKKFTAVKDVRRIEDRIRQEGLTGWLAKSERDHTTMHEILKKLGAQIYAEDKENLHFMKEVK